VLRKKGKLKRKGTGRWLAVGDIVSIWKGSTKSLKEEKKKGASLWTAGANEGKRNQKKVEDHSFRVAL